MDDCGDCGGGGSTNESNILDGCNSGDDKNEDEDDEDEVEDTDKGGDGGGNADVVEEEDDGRNDDRCVDVLPLVPFIGDPVPEVLSVLFKEESDGDCSFVSRRCRASFSSDIFSFFTLGDRGCWGSSSTNADGV